MIVHNCIYICTHSRNTTSSTILSHCHRDLHLPSVSASPGCGPCDPFRLAFSTRLPETRDHGGCRGYTLYRYIDGGPPVISWFINHEITPMNTIVTSTINQS